MNVVERAINVWVECGQQVHIRATTVSTDTISGRWWWRVGRCIWKREYGNNLSVVGDIDTTGDLILIRMRVRYGGTQNSNFIFRTISQRIIVLDFVIRERTGKFLCLIHTPSNILFSRAFSDTSYNDLMKISYTGDTTIYSTSESATSTAGALVVYGVGISRKVNINDNMDVSSCFVGASGSAISCRFRQFRFIHHRLPQQKFWIKYVKCDERFYWIRIRFNQRQPVYYIVVNQL
jgi:hypothetical protein